jgi:hypothetical protein
MDGVLRIPVAEIVLDKPQIMTAIGEDRSHRNDAACAARRAADQRLIPRSIADEIRNLGPDQRAEGKDDRQCDHGEASGWDAAEVNST